MNGRMSLFALFVLAIGCSLVGTSARAQAQSFVGKWAFQGPRGTSVMEFFPGEKHLIGPMRGSFHHSIILDDGRLIEGSGTYVFRSVLPNRGWLTLTFADGHVTTEHEQVLEGTVLSIRHHGITRNYVRQ